jgi:branched-chain amino acid transport system permease protein
MFALSALFMSLTGAVMAPRWTYIDPAIAFSPLLSFEVVIMALLGGAGSLFGPRARRRAAGAVVRGADRQFPELFLDPARDRVHHHRLLLPRGVIGLLPSGRVIAAQPASPPDAHGAGRAARSVGLRKAFGGLVAVGRSVVLRRPRRAVGLIGPNGSGKTTVLNMLSGALSADRRHDPLQGRDLCAKCRIASRGSGCAHLPARARARSMTVIENVMPGFEFRATPLTGAKAEAAAMDAARARRPRRQGRAAGGRSSPTSTRSDSSLPAALALEPDLLLLDEWLAGLNPT